MQTEVLKNILERLVREREALKEGLEVVKAVESLEQVERDLKRRVVALNEGQARLIEQKEAVLLDIEAAKTGHAAVLQSGKDAAAKFLDDAKKVIAQERADLEAEKITAKNLLSLVEEATREAKQELASLNDSVKKAKADLVDYEEKKALLLAKLKG